jgi:hypothetical protein
MERVNPPPKASPFVKTTTDSMPGRATQECASSFVKTTADKAGKAPFSDKRTEDFPGLC